MNTELIRVLLDNPSVIVSEFLAYPLAGCALAYGAAWQAMRPRPALKEESMFWWHANGVAATVICSAIFRLVVLVMFDGSGAFRPVAKGGVAAFYLLIVPAAFAASYIVWLKKKLHAP